MCCLASLSFTCLFFGEFSSGILGCALGVPAVHLSSGVCTVSSVCFPSGSFVLLAFAGCFAAPVSCFATSLAFCGDPGCGVSPPEH